VATIVEYSSQRKAINAYPAKIVSPPVPSACCEFSSDQVGGGPRGERMALCVPPLWGLRLHRAPICTPRGVFRDRQKLEEGKQSIPTPDVE